MSVSVLSRAEDATECEAKPLEHVTSLVQRQGGIPEYITVLSYSAARGYTLRERPGRSLSLLFSLIVHVHCDFHIRIYLLMIHTA